MVKQYLITSRLFKCRAVLRAASPSAKFAISCIWRRRRESRDPLLVSNVRPVILSLSLAAAHHESKGFRTLAAVRLTDR